MKLPEASGLVEVVERDGEWNEDVPIRGYSERVTQAGNRVVTIYPWADPSKRDPAWLDAERKKQPNISLFRREYLLDWTAGDGDVFFPEFTENGGRETYVLPLTKLIPGPVYRGWDFGKRAPACVWFQYDDHMNRVLLFRSLAPTHIGIHAFRDLVLYLSGQVPREYLTLQASIAWLGKIEADPVMPPTPWFESTPSRPLTFVDFGGWESTAESDMVKEDSQAQTRAEVLAEAEIYLTEMTAATHRDTLTRELLNLRSDGWPGLIIDPSNVLYIEALAGGLTYKKATPEDPKPSTYRKDGVHDNVYEAAGYGFVGAVPAVRYRTPAATTVYDGRRRVTSQPIQGLGFKEGRR